MKYLLFFIIPITLFAQPVSYYSVSTHFGQFYRSDMDSLNMIRMLDSIKSAGINFIRDECYWSEVEKTRDIYEYPDQVDNFIEAAAVRGIGVLLILNYNNSLYAPHSGSGITTDSNRTAFTKYCIETVKRYLPLGVKHYEIWNEPNIPMFWDTAPNANDYFKILKEVYPALKTIDTSIIILGCATSPAEGNPAPFISGINFIRQVYDFGGANYMDGVSFHFYTVDKPVENWFSSGIEAIKNIVKNKPLYLTETGYPTSSVWPNVSQNLQALYLSRLYLLARKDLQMVSWYDLKNDGENPNENEHNFGLLNYNFSPKPAFIAYKNTIALTSGKTLNSISVRDNVYHYIFRNKIEETHAIWTPTQGSKITSTFPEGALKVVSALGSTNYIFDKDGTLTITAAQEPKFITGIKNLPEIDYLEFINAEDSLLPGQKISYAIRGFTKDGKEISIDFSAVDWSFSNSSASFDSTGFLTAHSAGKGFVTAGFFGREVTKEIEIFPYTIFNRLESFNSISNIKITFSDLLPVSSVSVVDSSFSESGKAMLIDYAFKYKSKTSHKITFEKDYKLLGEPDSLLFDVYNNGNGHVVNIQLEDVDNESFSISSKGDFLLNKYNWVSVSIPLTTFGNRFNYPARLKKITLYTIQQDAKADSVYKGKILLDNLRVHNRSITDVRTGVENPSDFTLYQNYPNPFNPNTTIRYRLPSACKVSIKIYNTLGETIREFNELKSPGEHELFLNISALPSGVYLYAIEANSVETNDSFREIRKMMLLK